MGERALAQECLTTAYLRDHENQIGRAENHVICSPVYVYYVSLRDVLRGLTPALKRFLGKFAPIVGVSTLIAGVLLLRFW